MDQVNKIEGLILFKSNYKSRDLLIKIINREGEIIDLICYRGMGGGKKQGSSILEVGFMVSFVLQPQSQKGKTLLIAKEWHLIWGHTHIRYNYSAYSHLCFYVEVMQKMGDGERNFAVISNAVSFLDSYLESYPLPVHDTIFLSKMIAATGIYPELTTCVLCQSKLAHKTSLSFIPEKGGFACCHHQGSEIGDTIYRLLCDVKTCKYQDLFPRVVSDDRVVKLLFSFFCFHFQLSSGEFKSFSFA